MVTPSIIPKNQQDKNLVSALSSQEISVRDQEFSSGLWNLNIFFILLRSVPTLEGKYSMLVGVQHRSNDRKRMKSVRFFFCVNTAFNIRIHFVQVMVRFVIITKKRIVI